MVCKELMLSNKIHMFHNLAIHGLFNYLISYNLIPNCWETILLL